MTQNNWEGWSQKYYPGLPGWQHEANNEWFRKMLEVLSPTGTLGVPNLGKAFNKQGAEIGDAEQT